MAEALWSNSKAKWMELTSISILSIKASPWGTLGRGFLKQFLSQSEHLQCRQCITKVLSHCAEVIQQTIIEPGSKTLFQIHQNLGITLHLLPKHSLTGVCKIHSLQQGLANIFCKEPDSKYLGFKGHTVSVITAELCWHKESSHRSYVNKEV